jgi:hypothetical protein
MLGAKYESTITFGNLLSVGAMVTAVFLSWSNLATEQRLQDARITVVETTIRERVAFADQDRAAKEARIRALESQASGFAADLRNIQATAGRIEAAVEQINKKVSP